MRNWNVQNRSPEVAVLSWLETANCDMSITVRGDKTLRVGDYLRARKKPKFIMKIIEIKNGEIWATMVSDSTLKLPMRIKQEEFEIL